MASLLVHLALIAPFVMSWRPVADATDPIDQLVVFLVPPDVVGGRGAAGSPIQWSDPAGRDGVTEAPPPLTDVSQDALDLGDPGDTEPFDSVITGRMAATESALTEIEVDSVVERDPTSVAPRYPEAMLLKHVEGSTFVHYVVDTTGRVDTTTIRVIRTTAPEFAVAVKDALALMKFRPAIQSTRKVRQWVEQNFAFRIVAPQPADTT
jgi:TonB family protein